jgi:hypothetical protein
LSNIFYPANPKEITVLTTHVEFAATTSMYLTLHSAISAYYVIGATATADGNQSHYIGPYCAIDLYVPSGSIISMISSDGVSTGKARITEWI